MYSNQKFDQNNYDTVITNSFNFNWIVVDTSIPLNVFNVQLQRDLVVLSDDQIYNPYAT